MKTIPFKKSEISSPLKIEKQEEKSSRSRLADHFLFVKTTENIHCIVKDDIAYLHASGNYTSIICKNGERILASKTLKYFETFLHKSHFVRIHQSYFINLLFVSKVHLKQSFAIQMNCGKVLPVSRSRQANLQAIFKN